jgi:two-component system, LytTR family, sensor kinase
MPLEMKARCEKCAATLQAVRPAYICSHECTFCSECALQSHYTCPHCAGELVRRPVRKTSAVNVKDSHIAQAASQHSFLVWAVSFGVWMFVALAAAGSIYEFDRSTGGSMRFLDYLGLECSQILTYFPLTPFVFAFAIRFPVQRSNWMRRSLLYFAGGLAFCVAHITLRGVTPYANWDAQTHSWASAIWGSRAHVFRIQWNIFEQLFFRNVVDDITGTYVPILLIAHAVSYYRRFRERELRTAQLETQLAKAHLRALKSQLEPHFLFNTLHSISSLMLTDVTAADQMMSLLSDLLRMSLASAESQITTLSDELDFVNGYLEIEKLRFEDRLKVVLDIAPDTLDSQVPHLVLQPLVENAVRHGVSRLSSGGEIRIASSHDDRSLHLRVTDNGPGLAECADVPPHGGLGLGATRERLRTLYGDDQQLDIRNGAQGGAEVYVRIPFSLDPSPTIGEGYPAVSLEQIK